MGLDELDRLGIEYRRTEKWVGKPGTKERHPVPLDQVRSIKLPLTEEQWCCLCMRDGPHYMGGCCGNMSSLQDIMNGIFRDSGWIDSSDDLRRIANLCIRHDGFEMFKDVNILNVALEQGLDSLNDPWDRVAVVWHAVEDVLVPLHLSWNAPSDGSNATREIPKFEEAVRIAFKHLGTLRYEKFFLGNESNPNPQHRINHNLHLSGLLSAFSTIYEDLKARETDELIGFGLRSNEDGKPGENGYGLCLYADKKSAEDVLTVWEESDKFDRTKWTIAPFRVTLADGLVWLDQ